MYRFLTRFYQRYNSIVLAKVKLMHFSAKKIRKIQTNIFSSFLIVFERFN